MWVYALTDPRNEDARYVGITSNLDTRYRAHLQGQPNNPEKNRWIRDLVGEGCYPGIQILERFTGPIARERALVAERFWIAEAKSQGFQLLNRRDR